MSILNELKKIRKNYPNDQEFGNVVSKFLESQKTCCDDEKNLIPFEDKDSHPYGAWVKGTKCRNCGKIVEFEVER